MAFGQHNISIEVVNATKSRAYAFTGFAVAKTERSVENRPLIIGSVLGALSLLSLAIFGLVYARRRRRRGKIDPELERHAVPESESESLGTLIRLPYQLF